MSGCVRIIAEGRPGRHEFQAARATDKCTNLCTHLKIWAHTYLSEQSSEWNGIRASIHYTSGRLSIVRAACHSYMQLKKNFGFLHALHVIEIFYHLPAFVTCNIDIFLLHIKQIQLDVFNIILCVMHILYWLNWRILMNEELVAVDSRMESFIFEMQR